MTNKKRLPLLAKWQAAIKSKRNDLIQTHKSIISFLEQISNKKRKE